MSRWPNGGPKKLYVLIDNITGEIQSFDKKKARTEYVVENHLTYPDGAFTFLTYVQEGGK